MGWKTDSVQACYKQIASEPVFLNHRDVDVGYDQDAWTTALNYHDQDLQDALDVLRLARKTTYELLKKQPDDVFDHFVMHPEYTEPYTLENWLNIYSAHIPGHIEQIMNNYKIWRDQHG